MFICETALSGTQKYSAAGVFPSEPLTRGSALNPDGVLPQISPSPMNNFWICPWAHCRWNDGRQLINTTQLPQLRLRYIITSTSDDDDDDDDARRHQQLAFAVTAVMTLLLQTPTWHLQLLPVMRHVHCPRPLVHVLATPFICNYVCIVDADTLLLLRIPHSFLLLPLLHRICVRFSFVQTSLIDLKQHNVQNDLNSSSSIFRKSDLRQKL